MVLENDIMIKPRGGPKPALTQERGHLGATAERKGGERNGCKEQTSVMGPVQLLYLADLTGSVHLAWGPPDLWLPLREVICITALLVHTLLPRKELLVKTGWEELRQVWSAIMPRRADHTTQNSNET